MNFLDDIVDYLRVNHAAVVEALAQHVWLAFVPVAIAFVLALPIGWAVERLGWLRHSAMVAASIIYTIPSLALFLILPGILGTGLLDPINVVIALAAYSLALLVRTTADGLAAVDPHVLQAATAMGYRPLRRWLQVQLPMAMPVILSGLRVATVTNVSMVSVAALIGVQNLGQLFTRGFQLGLYAPPIVIGLVLSVALALAADAAIVIVQRMVTPWVRAGAAR